MSAERMPLKCAMRSSSAGHCGARACNYPFCVEIPRGGGRGRATLSSADFGKVRKCPVCGAMGFRRVGWIGPQLIGHCRAGHPYILRQSE